MHEQHPPATATNRTCSVLIAAGDQRMRAALRALVEADGRFSVVGQARSVGEAIVLDAELHPALILLDLLIPEVSAGLDAVRALALVSRRPIVAVGAQASVRQAALAAGAAGFVIQGEGADVLLPVLAAACAQPPEPS